MNKKQSIVAWLMILSIAIMIVRTIMLLSYDPIISIFQFYSSFFYIILIGGSLILLLRDRKK